LQKHSMRKQENCRVDIIQFDEPAFNVWGSKWLGMATLERAMEGLHNQTAVHICYGYGIKEYWLKKH
jgi:5-methyltetrahydropteroyltriglutamate--homocysteine methyltransferase